MNEPKRREQRRTHLDASAVPVERALQHRARELAEAVLNEPDLPPTASAETVLKHGLTAVVRSLLAEELQHLAEELHWW